MGEKRTVKDIILKNNSFFISSHISPDGDSIGSQLALALCLEKLKKNFYIYNQDPVPWRFENFPDIKWVKNSAPSGDFDVIFFLDTANIRRLGTIIKDIELKDKFIVNIDHHISNELFGTVNIIKPDYSSTSEILYELLKPICEIDKDIAQLLYLGICTDTGSFKYPNTRANTFDVSSKLVKIGVDPSAIASRIWFEDRPNRVRLLGDVLRTLEIHNGYTIMYVTRKMLHQNDSNEAETEEFCDYGLTIKGVKVSVLLKERDKGIIKVSLRSKKGTDVNQLAVYFGGGGHKNAAGFEVEGKIEDVISKIQHKIGEII